MFYALVALAGVLVGGYGGYQYGAHVQAKATAALKSAESAANAAKKAL